MAKCVENVKQKMYNYNTRKYAYFRGTGRLIAVKICVLSVKSFLYLQNFIKKGKNK